MVSQFIFVQSLNTILNVADVVRIKFYEQEIGEDEEVENEASLLIVLRDTEAIELEGDECEATFLGLVEQLPNLIVVK